MKKCPKCNRTYADDGFTFCLEDGALLSAPYESEKKEEPVSTIQSAGPPPTAVLPATTSSKQAETKSAPLSPTVASPVREQFDHPSLRAKKRGLPPLIAIPAVVLVLIVTAVSLYALKRSSCPKVKAYCNPPQENLTFCYLGPSEANSNKQPGYFLGRRFPEMTWSTSLGRISRENSDGNIDIDTTGLAGREITVKITYGPVDWLCPNNSSVSFVAK